MLVVMRGSACRISSEKLLRKMESCFRDSKQSSI